MVSARSTWGGAAGEARRGGRGAAGRERCGAVEEARGGGGAVGKARRERRAAGAGAGRWRKRAVRRGGAHPADGLLNRVHSPVRRRAFDGEGGIAALFRSRATRAQRSSLHDGQGIVGEADRARPAGPGEFDAGLGNLRLDRAGPPRSQTRLRNLAAQLARALSSILPSSIRGRRECRAPDAPDSRVCNGRQ